ncbi:glycoside hydrolase [Altererythrobacter sp. CAU 1778]
MELTFIGAIQIAIGVAILVAGSLRAAFLFFVFSCLFGGSAAIILPALGGSSIPPAQIALLFVALRIVAPAGGHFGRVPEALRANIWLLVYTGFGIASAILAPRIFEGKLDVAPMRPIVGGGLFETVPLAPSPQNLTAAFYLFGTLVAALSAFILTRHLRGGKETLVNAALWVGWAHLLLGLAVALFAGTPLDTVFEALRNGSYAQLNQSYQGFVRIRGVFPESSAYAEFGFAWFVVNAELWYRGIRPRATGLLALYLAAILVASTSSTAYVGLAAYLAWFGLRVVFVRSAIEGKRLAQFGAGVLAIAVAVSALLLASPDLSARFVAMVEQMTIGKSASASAEQRLFWATQGWEAFRQSFGLGIGAGSFRSSSFLTAVAGSMGVIGILSFTLYGLRVFEASRRSTYGRGADPALSIGGAFAVAAVLSLVPAAVSSPRPDPGVIFAIFAGAAIGLRPRRAAAALRGDGAETEANRGALPGGAVPCS